MEQQERQLPKKTKDEEKMQKKPPSPKVLKWFDIARERFIDAEVSASSAVITYYMLLSLFPLFIALGNILSLFKINPETIVSYVNVLVPETIQATIDPIITNLLTSGSGGMFSISAIGLLWAASKGVGYLQKCMDKVYDVPISSNLIFTKGVAVVLIMALLLLMAAITIIVSFGQIILRQLAENFLWAQNVEDYFNRFKWPVSLAVVFVVLMLAYTYIPHVKLRYREVWPGALVGLVGILALTQLFSIYVRFASKSLSTYEALGTFIVLMLWLNFSSTIILCGTILNATLYEYKYGKAKPKESKLDLYLRRKVEGWIVALSQKTPFSKINFVKDFGLKMQAEIEAADKKKEDENSIKEIEN